jgi:hypothetical protein
VTLTDHIKLAVNTELERRRVTTDGEPGLQTVSLIVRLGVSRKEMIGFHECG